MPTGEYKRYIKIHVQTAFKLCEYFAFGSKHWESSMAKDGRTPDDYFMLSKSERKIYDNAAQDRIVATLVVQGCKYPSL